MGRSIWTFACTVFSVLVFLGLSVSCVQTTWFQPSTPSDAQKGIPQSPPEKGQKEPENIHAVKPSPRSSVQKETPQTQPVKEQKKSDYIHVVKWSGETLSIIANWYCGSLTKWQELADFNPDIYPNKIFIGNQIRIPESLLVTRQPMPESYPAQFSQEPKAKETSVNTPPPEDEGLLLFGPKNLHGTGKK